MSFFPFVQTCHRDVLYALRLIKRRPLTAASALVTVAFGIGLTATIFSVAHSVLWRELSLPDGERLVYLQEVRPPPARERTRVSPANAADWERSSRTLQTLATISPLAGVLVEETRAEEIGCAAVSPTFFQVLLVNAARGRLLNPGDYAPASVDSSAREPNASRLLPLVTVISDGLWRGYFGSRSDIVGHKIQMRRFGIVEIVGVLEEDFDLPMFDATSCWLPDTRLADVRGSRYLMALGLLAPNVTLADAQAEFDVIAAQLAAAHPATNKDYTVSVTLLREHVTSSVRMQLWFLTGGALCVLLIVCVNVSNLLLASTSGRQAEFGTRLALGATRSQLVRQTLTEALLLAGAGGFAGLLLALWAVPWLVSRAPPNLPRLLEIRIDASVIALSVATSIGLAVVAGLIASAGVPIDRPAHDVWRQAPSRSSGVRYRTLLIVAEVALALVLANAAALLVQSMRAVSALPLGFDGSNLMAIELSPDPSRLRSLGGIEALVARVRAVPGVLHAAIGSPPLGRGLPVGAIALPADPARYVTIDVKAVGPGYLEALGIDLRAGRFIDERDVRTAPTVAVLNERARRLVFPAEAVGHAILYEGQTVDIVGVVEHVRFTGLESEPNPTMFLSNVQGPITFSIDHIVVRTVGEPRDLLPAIRTVIAQFDPQLPLTEIETLPERLAAITAPRRFSLWLVVLFSIASIGLAMVGIYGVVADWVAQRVPEIGVRMALGATKSTVRWLVIRQGALMIAAGIAIGGVATLATHQLTSAMVFGVSMLNPASYGVAFLALGGAGIAACLIPAHRAARVDPATALRRE